jgi:inner membrane protein
LTDGLPRPASHALLTVGLLAAVGYLLPGERRPYALGAAFGVGAHLCRDVATGPGVALFWPLTSAVVKAPYVVFAVGLAMAVALTFAVAFQQTR